MIEAKALKASVDLLNFISRQSGLSYKLSAKSPTRGVEYHGECPFCGGEDRFHIQPDIGLWWCRQCSQEKHAHDIFDFVSYLYSLDLKTQFREIVAIVMGDRPINPSQLQAIAAEREAEQKAREEAAEKEQENIRSQIALKRPWERFSGQMTPGGRVWWEKGRGVPLWAQEAWFLGETQNIWSDFYGEDRPGDAQHKHAYTIPYFQTDGQFVTMQARFEIPNGQGPYHNMRSLPMAPFITNYQKDFSQVVVHEGAIKAMNGYIWGCGDKYQVVSVPSENTLKVVVPLLTQTKKAWIWLDPDTWDKPENAAEDWLPYPLRLGQMIHEVNKECDIRYVSVGFKADDALHDGMTKEQYLRILSQARPGKRIRL
jgi:hypothetical protein